MIPWAGAGAAALGALVAEGAGHQAATRFRMRIGWLGPAVRLPGQVAGERTGLDHHGRERLDHGR